MEDLEHALLGKAHHAYLILGADAPTREQIRLRACTSLGISPAGNPDVLTFMSDALLVDDARTLGEHAVRAPLGPAKAFFISFSFAGVESQNALLKLFEEPTPRTHFFVFVPSLGTLLPTLRSRLMLIRLQRVVGSELGRDFLSLEPGERVRSVKKLIDDKDKSGALQLVDSLSSVMHNSFHSASYGNQNSLDGGAALLRARRSLESRGASVKMILEYLASVLPKM